MAELQRFALTAVRYRDLIAIALYANTPSEAYRVTADFGWYNKKIASCRFLSVILRDYGIEEFEEFVQTNNPEAHQSLCWCECHRDDGHDYFYDSGEDCECDCCSHHECFRAAHTFRHKCESCEADDEEDEENRCDMCDGNACSICSCFQCDPDECSSYQDDNCTGSACENCKCNDCEWAGQEKEQSAGTERRRERSEEVPESVSLPLGRVGRIAQRLFEVTGKGYDVGLFESSEDAAWADGDTIGISTGALSRYDDDELAIVMSHELAHNLNEHPQEAHQRIIALLNGVSRAVRYEGILWGVACGVINHAINRKADRDSELEADRAAVEIAKRAGFDSRKAARVLGQPQIGGGIFDTHPSAERRIRNIS